MPTDTITPRDAAETATLSTGARIAAAIGIIGTAVPALLAAVGGLDWITANLPLLLTGLGSLVSGGVASWIAVRRMRVDRIASKAPLILLLILPVLMLALITGCTGVYTPKLSAISFGLDSAQALSGLNVTRCQTAETNDYYEIILDSSSGQQSSGKLIDGIIAIGEIAARAKGLPVASVDPAASEPSAVSASDAAPADDGQTAYSADGYGGTPGPTGEGVYGRPACGRCRAYRAAHPETALINIDTGGHLADMWAALRLRGHTGSSVSLPVQITADGYIQAAK